jgi:ketosteroid isomerase-like protein
MSQENVELSLLLAVDVWNRRDAEAGIALMDADCVWYPEFEGITKGRTWRGHAEMRRYFEELAEWSGESHAEHHEVHDLGDQVLGLGHVWLRFAGGVNLDVDGAFLFTWRNGKCVDARAWMGLRRSRQGPQSRRAAGVELTLSPQEAAQSQKAAARGPLTERNRPVRGGFSIYVR